MVSKSAFLVLPAVVLSLCTWHAKLAGCQESRVPEAEVWKFWNETLTRAASEPLEFSVEQIKEPLPYLKYRVTYRSLDGVKVRAYLSKPIQGTTSSKQLPAIITAPGYGGREHGVMLAECQRGYIVLQVDPRSQGESAELWSIDGPDFLTWHISRPEGYFYQGAYIDVLRAIDYLSTRGDVDNTLVGMMATSAGGGIVLAVASIDQRIRAVVAHLPCLCSMRRAAEIPGSLVRDQLEKYRTLNSESLNTLDFFDPVNLVSKLQVPTLISAGGKDRRCPRESIQDVFERIPGTKALAFFPSLVHTSSEDFYGMSWEWMARYLRH